MDVQARPKSYATAAYFGNNAFVFVDGQGKRQPVRYQIIPAAGEVNLDSAAAAKQGEDYLQGELQRRLAKEPVQFRSLPSCLTRGIPPRTARSCGPPDRKRILLGTIRLTQVEPNQEEFQRSLAFNPIFLTNGISYPTTHSCRSGRRYMRCLWPIGIERLSPVRLRRSTG